MRSARDTVAIIALTAIGATPLAAQMPPATATAPETATAANAGLIRRLDERVRTNSQTIGRLRGDIETLRERLRLSPTPPEPAPPPPAFQAYDTQAAQLARIADLRSALEYQRDLIYRLTQRRDALRRRLR